VSEDDDELTAWAARAENRTLLAAAKALQETASCARGINDDESDTLPPAQQATIDALHGVFKIAGAEDVLLAKVVGFALDKVRASGAEVERVLHGIEADPDARLETQQRIVRKMAMCAAVDIGFLPRRMTFFSAWSLFLGANGRKAAPAPQRPAKNAYGPAHCRKSAPEDEGNVWSHTPVVGVDPNTGSEEVFKAKLVRMIGYTTGWEELPTSHRLTQDITARALAMWEVMRAHAHFPLPAIKLKTLRKWCGPNAPLELSEQFEIAYRRGLADHAANKTDTEDFLPWV
jgi:hypothetical protein